MRKQLSSRFALLMALDAFWMSTLCVAMVAGCGSSGSLSLAQPAPPLRQVLTPLLVLQAPPLRQVLPPLMVLPPPPPRQVLQPFFDLAAAAASALNLLGDTSFVAAAACGHVAAASFILSRGADVNSSNTNGFSPLISGPAHAFHSLPHQTLRTIRHPLTPTSSRGVLVPLLQSPQPPSIIMLPLSVFSFTQALTQTPHSSQKAPLSTPTVHSQPQLSNPRVRSCVILSADVCVCFV